MNMARTKDWTLRSCMIWWPRDGQEEGGDPCCSTRSAGGSRGGGGGATIYWKEDEQNGQMIFGLMMEEVGRLLGRD